MNQPKEPNENKRKSARAHLGEGKHKHAIPARTFKFHGYPSSAIERNKLLTNRKSSRWFVHLDETAQKVFAEQYRLSKSDISMIYENANVVFEKFKVKSIIHGKPSYQKWQYSSESAINNTGDVVTNPGSDASEVSDDGYFSASGAPSQEAQLIMNQVAEIGDTLFITKAKPLRKGGRPAKGAKKKQKGPKLRMFGLKLTDQEFALIESLRERTGAFSAADTIRGALRTYDVVTAAMAAGKEVILEDPRDKRDRKLLNSSKIPTHDFGVKPGR